MTKFLTIYYLSGSTFGLFGLLRASDTFFPHGPFYIASFYIGIAFFSFGYYVAFRLYQQSGELFALAYQLPQLVSVANSWLLFRCFSGAFLVIGSRQEAYGWPMGFMGSWHLHIWPEQDFGYWHINIIAAGLALAHFLRHKRANKAKQPGTR